MHIKEIAALVGYHEYHLNRLYVKYTGMSLHKYILNKRLYEAKMLIPGSNMPLGEIAEQFGFNNYSFFSSYFKKHFGVSPNRFKEESRYVSP